METSNAIYGSGMATLAAPVPPSPTHRADAGVVDTDTLPNLPHLRQTNYPYKPRYLPQVFSSQRISPTKTIVFEKPLGSTASAPLSATAASTTSSTVTRTAREGRFGATSAEALTAAHAHKQVLRVTAFTQEGVPESPDEAARHRKLIICFHLSDMTMEINEPREDNSGLMQGPFLHRHRIPRFPDAVPGAPKPASDDAGHEFFDWRDLIVGTELVVYGRTLHIVDADAFTRDWYAKQGITQAPAEEIPADPVAEKLAKAKTSGGKVDTGHGKVMFPAKLYQEARLGKFIRDPVARHKFQMHDGKILRFDCLWDDTEHEYGDRHHLVLEYYLADDQAEVRIVHSNNNGRDPVASLLRKGALPKDWVRAREATPAERPELFVQPKDLRIGETIDVYGRKVQIRACDPWTREWFASEEGVRAYGTAPQPENIVEVDHPPAPREFVPPPHMGIGSDEDSLQSCFSFNVKPLKKNFTKWARNDGTIYRFHARLQSDSVLDSRRRFTIACFPSDDSLSIVESAVRNSGFKGGVFLKRNKHRKADGKPYTAADFKPNTTVAIYAHKFVLLEADLFTGNLLPEWAAAHEAQGAKSEAEPVTFATTAELGGDTSDAPASGKTVTFSA